MSRPWSGRRGDRGAGDRQAWLLARGIAELTTSVVPALAAVIVARAALLWATEWLADRSAAAVKTGLAAPPDRRAHAGGSARGTWPVRAAGTGPPC